MTPTKKKPMPPPGKKPDLTVIVGAHPPNGGGPKDDPMLKGAPPPDDGGGGGGKASAEEALVVRSDKHCGQCAHYQGESGACEKVDGFFDVEDSCLRYFEPDGGEPDADEQGGPPDQDADDMRGGMPPGEMAR